MFLEILLAILIGVTAGTLTGITPGIHVNLLAVIAITLPFAPLTVVSFLLAMAMTHSIVNAIPSIYLGAPDESMILAALPGHQMLHEGKGYLAVLLTIFGSISALLICIACAYPLYHVVTYLSPIITPYIGYILIGVVLYLAYRVKNTKTALFYFFVSGVLGLLVFTLPLRQPLLPLLSGLFGISLLILSSKGDIPKQSFVTVTKIQNKSTLLAFIFGFFASFLPGLGSSQAAILASEWLKNATKESFLVLVGGINTVNMTLSIVTVIAIEKARNGVIVAMSHIISPNISIMTFLFGVVLLSSGLAGSIAPFIAKIFSQITQRIPYTYLIITIITGISGIVFYFDGFLGLILLITATSLGVSGSVVSKHFLMGCLLFPVILYFIPI